MLLTSRSLSLFALLSLLVACSGRVSSNNGSDGGAGNDSSTPVDSGNPGTDSGPGAVCGDGACNNGETCSTCDDDCGACGNVCDGAMIGPPNYTGENSGSQAAGSTAQQMMGLVRSNHWRTAAGLPAFNGNVQVQAAAQSHAHFLATTPDSCHSGAHNQVNSGSCPGFTGEWPWDRMNAAGFDGFAYAEVINWNTGANSVIDGWIWTVYHREPFMDIAYDVMGYGTEDDNNVVDFGGTLSPSSRPDVDPAMFPVPGQLDVNPEFDGRYEGPMPPTPDDGTWPSGTVVSVTFPDEITAVASHALYDEDCNPVAHSAHSHLDDSNAGDSFFFMYANSPLAGNTRYTAEVHATYGSTPWSAVWSFTTE